MRVALLDIINFIVIFQLLVFIFFLLRKKTGRPSNRLLALFLFAQVMIILNFLFYRFSEIIVAGYPHLLHVGLTFILIPAPSFYLYVKSIAYSDFRLKKSHLLHLLPFVLVTAFFSVVFYFYSAETKRFIFRNSPFLPREFWVGFNILIFAQLLIYNIAGLRVLSEYRKAIREQFSSIQNINLSWLNFILYGFLFSWLTSVLVFVNVFIPITDGDTVTFINFLAFFIFFNIIFYKALIQPEIFSGVEERQKYQSSKLTAAEAEEYLSKLQTHMEKNKPYLNPTISLKDLADQLTIPPRHLSQIVNEHIRKNFYDFISQYRIEEAKKMFRDSSIDKTVLEVLFEVGFNSKSSFNTAFKKFTGVTPSKFKDMN